MKNKQSSFWNVAMPGSLLKLAKICTNETQDRLKNLKYK